MDIDHVTRVAHLEFALGNVQASDQLHSRYDLTLLSLFGDIMDRELDRNCGRLFGPAQILPGSLRKPCATDAIWNVLSGAGLFVLATTFVPS